MLRFTCGFSKFKSEPSALAARWRPHGPGRPVKAANCDGGEGDAVGFLFPPACTEVNLTWLNTVMSHTKLLWPVLTQRRVCTAPCWLCTHISNTSDIHSPTTVTLTPRSCRAALRFPDKHYLLWHGAPGHTVACVVSLVKHLGRLLGCRS